MPRGSIRELNAPKRMIIKQHPSMISPGHINDFNVDNISIDSFERTASPQQNINSSPQIRIVRTNQLNSIKTTSNGKIIKSVPWYKSMKGLLIAAGILSAICLVVVLPTVLGIILTNNPNVQNSVNSSIAIRTVTWSFDGNANDANNTYVGTVNNGVFSNNTYFGIGSSLNLPNGANAYVTVASPFFNLSYTSFTVEAWIYLTLITGDNILFSQCYCTSCQDQCISLGIRNGKLYMSISLNILLGSTTLAVNVWYHVAYVYDYSARIQSVYLLGILDGTKTSVGSYQGQSGAIMFGILNLIGSTYSGYIDALTLTTTAKSTSSILSDATLIAYFSFDGSSLTRDGGPNALSTNLQNGNAVTGKIGRALSFSGSMSYFQTYGIPIFNVPIRSFSFVMWIYPYLVTSGNLLQKAKSGTSTLPCNQLIGFNNIGQIVFFAPGLSNALVGQFISTNRWTHIGYTYSTTNGIIMYVNGVQYGTTGTFSYTTTIGIDYLNVGWGGNVCAQIPIVPGYYQGVIDEFYIYQRELTANEIATFAQ